MSIDFFKGNVDFFQHPEISAKLDSFVPLNYLLDHVGLKSVNLLISLEGTCIAGMF